MTTAATTITTLNPARYTEGEGEGEGGEEEENTNAPEVTPTVYRMSATDAAQMLTNGSLDGIRHLRGLLRDITIGQWFADRAVLDWAHGQPTSGDVILKTKPNIEYEFLVQHALNAMRRYVPHFAMALALFKCASMNPTPEPLCTDNSNTFVVMEDIEPGVTFEDRLSGGYSFGERVAVFVQVMFALQIAQDQLRFIHGDLSARNILMATIPDDEARVVFCYEFGDDVYCVPTPNNEFPVIIHFEQAYVDPDKMHPEPWNLKFDRDALTKPKGDRTLDMVRLFISTFGDCMGQPLRDLPRDLLRIWRLIQQTVGGEIPTGHRSAFPFKTPLEFARVLMQIPTYTTYTSQVPKHVVKYPLWNHPTKRGFTKDG